MKNLNRSSGILLHISSLPGKFSIGGLGAGAYQWIDFLHETGTRFWQFLPINPPGSGNSPYQALSAFAGNPLFIDPDELVKSGLVVESEIALLPAFPVASVNYKKTAFWKNKLFRSAYDHFLKSRSNQLCHEFELFKVENDFWLRDFALFITLFEEHKCRPWSTWPTPLKMREEKALHIYAAQNDKTIHLHIFLQFLFFRQWQQLRTYAKEKDVRLIGDIPIFMGYDSADVWANPHLFQLDKNRQRTAVAGVPPDFFSPTGQLWGNPLYDWDAHQGDNYNWWIKRVQATLQAVDLIRLDHFRGFASYFSVPAGSKTAQDGEWISGPGEQLFGAIQSQIGSLPFIAEDLGIITHDVIELRDKYNLPGMRLMQVAFSTDAGHEFLPHNYPVNTVAYTGTHDNDTTAGWYTAAPDHERRFCADYLGYSGRKNIAHEMIRAVWRSNARIAIAPMQDLLQLGSSARMNKPATAEGNWRWRMKPNALTSALAEWVKMINETFGRSLT